METQKPKVTKPHSHTTLVVIIGVIEGKVAFYCKFQPFQINSNLFIYLDAILNLVAIFDYCQKLNLFCTIPPEHKLLCVLHLKPNSNIRFSIAI